MPPRTDETAEFSYTKHNEANAQFTNPPEGTPNAIFDC
ncbi:MAG: hypothetical protein ACJAXT_001277, partial [Paracoccaceae bacterium]